MRVDIGGGFAYKGSDALAGKSSEGEQHGQEKDLEEVEEDSTDQASAGQSRIAGPSSISRSARSRCAGRAREQLAP